MKRFIKAGSNTVSIPSRLNTITAEDEAAEDIITLDDKIKDAENDFDYIISGLDQLTDAQADDMINDIHATLQQYINDIASYLS